MTNPSWPTELVSLPDVLDHLQLTGTSNVNFDQVQGFIDAATAFIQDLTGPIIPTVFTEVHDGGKMLIALRNPPVLAISSVIEYIGPTAYPLVDSELGSGQFSAYAYSLDSAAAGIIRRRYDGGLVGAFIGGVRNVVVTYTAGLTAVPADIRMAVLQDIAGLFQPSQLGPGTSMFPNSVGSGNGPLNPIGLFPRVAEILSAPTMRTPSIA